MPQLLESCFIKGLCEDVSELIICTYIRQVNITSIDVVPDEVVPDLNVLRLIVLNRIMSNLDGTLIVTQE
jgi:hypothetical protein